MSYLLIFLTSLGPHIQDTTAEGCRAAFAIAARRGSVMVDMPSGARVAVPAWKVACVEVASR